MCRSHKAKEAKDTTSSDINRVKSSPALAGSEEYPHEDLLSRNNNPLPEETKKIMKNRGPSKNAAQASKSGKKVSKVEEIYSGKPLSKANPKEAFSAPNFEMLALFAAEKER
jgi:hypothetical protein